MLQGPSSGPTWRLLILSSLHPGLTAGQSRGLNSMLATQGHHAHHVWLLGGGWDLAELGRVTSCLTGLRELQLDTIHVPGEAAVISRTLSVQSCIASVNFSGLAACVLPRTTKRLDLHVLPLGPHADLHKMFTEQMPFKRFLGCLRPLRSLEVLDLTMLPWLMTSNTVHHLVDCHPQLRELRLTLMAALYLGTQAVQSLQRFSGVRLELTISICDGKALAPLLQQLEGVQLHTLQLNIDKVRPAEEALLARCSMQELILRSSDPTLRLRHPPAGVNVVYKSKAAWLWTASVLCA